MSRIVDLPVTVEVDEDSAAPKKVRLPCLGWLPATERTVSAVLDWWREWYGALEGEPERDIWRVRLEDGAACELHRIAPLASLTSVEEIEGMAAPHEDQREGFVWLLHAWLD